MYKPAVVLVRLLPVFIVNRNLLRLPLSADHVPLGAVTLTVLTPAVRGCDVPTAMVVLRLVHRPGLMVARCRHIGVAAVVLRSRCKMVTSVVTGCRRVATVVVAVLAPFRPLFDLTGNVAEGESRDGVASVIVGLSRRREQGSDERESNCERPEHWCKSPVGRFWGGF